MSKVSLTSANSATARSTGFFKRIKQAFESAGKFLINIPSKISVTFTKLTNRKVQTNSNIHQKLINLIKNFNPKDVTREFFRSVSCGQSSQETEYKYNGELHLSLIMAENLTIEDVNKAQDICEILPNHIFIKDIARENLEIKIGNKTILYSDCTTKEKFGTKVMSALRRFASQEENRNGKSEEEFLLYCVKGFYKSFGQATGGQMTALFQNTGFTPQTIKFSAAIEFGKGGTTYKYSMQYTCRDRKDPDIIDNELLLEETYVAQLEYGKPGMAQIIPEKTDVKFYNTESSTTTVKNITPKDGKPPIYKVIVTPESLLNVQRKQLHESKIIFDDDDNDMRCAMLVFYTENQELDFQSAEKATTSDISQSFEKLRLLIAEKALDVSQTEAITTFMLQEIKSLSDENAKKFLTEKLKIIQSKIVSIKQPTQTPVTVTDSTITGTTPQRTDKDRIKPTLEVINEIKSEIANLVMEIPKARQFVTDKTMLGAKSEEISDRFHGKGTTAGDATDKLRIEIWNLRDEIQGLTYPPEDSSIQRIKEKLDNLEKKVLAILRLATAQPNGRRQIQIAQHREDKSKIV